MLLPIFKVYHDRLTSWDASIKFNPSDPDISYYTCALRGGEISPPPPDISLGNGLRGLTHKSKKVRGQKICNLRP